MEGIDAKTILEGIMMVTFGASWPFSILKTWRTKTAKGKSFVFLTLILLGYLCGIVSKFCGGRVDWLLVAVYSLNLLLVGTDYALCVVYTLREQRQAAGA